MYSFTTQDDVISESDFLYDLHRLNVAVTRARAKARSVVQSSAWQ